MTLVIVFLLGMVAGAAALVAVLGGYVLIAARDLPEPKREDKE